MRIGAAPQGSHAEAEWEPLLSLMVPLWTCSSSSGLVAAAL
uniref:Uncharacterized protein n=1 Tax=Anguilla anguilla TaxID=7936 RepID=A0A0E9QL99_ANGAN